MDLDGETSKTLPRGWVWVRLDFRFSDCMILGFLRLEKKDE